MAGNAPRPPSAVAVAGRVLTAGPLALDLGTQEARWRRRRRCRRCGRASSRCSATLLGEPGSRVHEARAGERGARLRRPRRLPAIDQHVVNVRAKLPDPTAIRTVRGVGYGLASRPAERPARRAARGRRYSGHVRGRGGARRPAGGGDGPAGGATGVRDRAARDARRTTCSPPRRSPCCSSASLDPEVLPTHRSGRIDPSLLPFLVDVTQRARGRLAYGDGARQPVPDRARAGVLLRDRGCALGRARPAAGWQAGCRPWR